MQTKQGDIILCSQQIKGKWLLSPKSPDEIYQTFETYLSHLILDTQKKKIKKLKVLLVGPSSHAEIGIPKNTASYLRSVMMSPYFIEQTQRKCVGTGMEDFCRKIFFICHKRSFSFSSWFKLNFIIKKKKKKKVPWILPLIFPHFLRSGISNFQFLIHVFLISR